MTNELEKQFFDTFGIEPKYCIASCDKCQHYSYDYCFSGYCTLDSDYNNCGVAEKQYPQITDRILLKLICIKNKELISIVQVKGNNLEELKSYILKMCIKGYTKYSNSSLSEYRELADNFKHQVRTLFEEG